MTKTMVRHEIPVRPAATPFAPDGDASTALLTDRYELTMVDAARLDGVAGKRAVFELFARRLPAGRRYGVVAGTGRALDAVERFRFDAAAIDHLGQTGVVSGATLEWLAGFCFRGDVHGLREGEIYGPFTPVLTVEGTFAEAVVLETVLLSVYNHDTAVASAAARMVTAAAGRGLVELGGRRTHEEAAVAAARAAWLVGFDATSNLEAGRRHGVPTVGSAAHAFTLAHLDEQRAFDAQLRTFGLGAVLLVDTFEIATGIDRAVAAARRLGGAGPGAIRIDSGDLAVEARRARAQLDARGARETRIVVTGDLDEHTIALLVAGGAPIDTFGVGTSVVTGSGFPTADFVYKLVAIEAETEPRTGSEPGIEPERAGPGVVLRAVAKTSSGKATGGGRKQVWRELDPDGHALGDRGLVDLRFAGPWLDARPELFATERFRALQVPLMRAGRVVHRPTLVDIRTHHRRALAELAPPAHDLEPGEPALALIPARREER